MTEQKYTSKQQSTVNVSYRPGLTFVVTDT